MVVTLFLTLACISCNQQPEFLPSPGIVTPTTSPTLQSTATFHVKTSTPQPSQTPRVIQNTQSPIPSNNPTKTNDYTRTPFVPVIGGADKIAFINQNEIWIADLDGQELTQLTDDTLPKSSLQWSPDNQGVIYTADLCLYEVNIHSNQTSIIACFDQSQRFESFTLSQDGKQAAISLDGQLYVIPFDREKLSLTKSGEDLIGMADCSLLAPYKHRDSMVTVNKARWSADGKQLAILRQAYENERQVELIQLIDITHCTAPIPRLDEFPATRFEMEGYDRHPLIQDFTWDGDDLFALSSYQRNDGFGDLWIYSTHLHRGFKSNPIDGKCCYRDPVFSPDGKYLAFIFRDAGIASDGSADLYNIPIAALEIGLAYAPIPLPTNFFSEPRTKPQPIFRSAR